ncbi:MAG: fibronectin type III domain-containing protein [Algoriphagus sp.]|nr:fibronectin type III domain-containing protein [Algoriphagus sp.]
MKNKITHYFLHFAITFISINSLFLTQAFSQGQDRDINIWELMERRDMRLSEIDALARRYFNAVGRERGSGHKQYERWKFEKQFHLDQNGFLLPEEYDQQQFNEAAPALETTNSTGWTEIGPTSWNRTSGWNPGVGRITSIAVYPGNTNIIYITSPGGGIWKSTQGGNQWIPLADQTNALMNVWSVAVHPTDPDYVLVGNGGSIYKSIDGGLSWTQRGSGMGTVRKILFDPTNPQILYAASSNGISKSIDGGNTWVRKITSATEDIEFMPGNTTVLYASGSDVFRSSSSGESWTQLTSSNGITTSGRTLISVSPSNPQVVYAVQASGSLFGRMYRSDDGGNSFITTVIGASSSGTNYFGYETNGTGTTGQASYDMAMTVNPLNANEVHIAGIICWKSTNGGTSFVAETAWSLPNSLGYNHADVHVLEWVGNSIYSGSDGGIYKSADNGDNWTELSSGLGIRQFYKIATSKTNPDLVMGGAQDNGTSIFKSTGWIDWLGADGMDCIVSPLDANLIWGTSQYGSLYRTSNGGSSYSSITEPATGAWVTPLAIESGTNTIYAGWNGVYRSSDLGVSWTKLSGSTISTNLNVLAVAPSNPQYIYAAAGTTIYVTKDGGTNWLTYPLSWTVSSFAIHPTNPEKVWISTTNTTNRVLLSSDAGATISNVSGNLPSIAARSVIIDDTANEGLYVAMNIGVYYTNNQMTGWVNLTEDLPLVAINEVEIIKNANKIRIGTYGRGAWERAIYTPCGNPAGLTSINITTTSATLSWQSLPEALGYNVEFKETGATNWSTAISNTTLNNFSLSGLTQGTAYDWRVSAVCSSGSSAFSVASFSTTLSCPAPTNLLTSGITTNSANLEWTSSEGATSYSLEYKLTSAIDWISLGTEIAGTTFTLNTLAEGATYEWRVAANCATGTGNFESAQFTSAIVCNAPGNLNTTNIAASSAILNWSAVPGATGYDVDFKLSAASVWTSKAINLAGTSFNLTGLTGGSTYDWRVRTNCGPVSGSSPYLEIQFTTIIPACGDSYESNNMLGTAKVITAGIEITAVIANATDQDWFELKVGNNKSTNVKVSLTDLPSTTYLYLYDKNGAILKSSENSGAASQTLIYNSTAVRTSYFILVKGDGASFSNSCYRLKPETSTVSFTDPNVCNPPAGLSTTGIGFTGATLNWTSVPNALNYGVEYKLKSASTWIVASTNTTMTSVVLSDLIEATEYDWRVSATCSAGSSTFAQSSFITGSSNCVDAYESNNVLADAKAISLGTNLTATIGNSTDVDWFNFSVGKSKSTNVRITLDGLPANYDVYLHNSAGQILASSLNSGSNSEQIIWNSAQTSITYYVRVIGVGGEFSPSCYTLRAETNTKAYSIANREIDLPETGKNEFSFQLKSEEDEFKVYPNPTRNTLNLEFYSPITYQAQIELIDMAGKVSMTQAAEIKEGQNHFILDLTAQNPGAYFIRLAGAKSYYQRKIIIR